MATIVGKAPAWQMVTLTFVRPIGLADVEWQEAGRTLLQAFKFIRNLQTIEIVGFVDNTVESMTQQMVLPEKVEDLYDLSQTILYNTRDALLRHVPSTDPASTIYRCAVKPLRQHIWGTLMTSADTLRCLEHSLMRLINFMMLLRLKHGLEPQVSPRRIEEVNKLLHWTSSAPPYAKGAVDSVPSDVTAVEERLFNFPNGDAMYSLDYACDVYGKYTNGEMAVLVWELERQGSDHVPAALHGFMLP